MIRNKHIKYLIFLVTLTIGLDYVVGNIYESLYFSEKSKKNDRLIQSVIGTYEDILIFGSSRALRHYNPQIIEDSLGMTCYNVGADGQNIYYHLALLNTSLERYTPKIAILELLSIDFMKTPPQWDTERLGVLLPFAKKSEAIYLSILRRGKYEFLKLFSGIYPFNSLQSVIIKNNFLSKKSFLKGYSPLQAVWDKPKAEEESKPGEVDNLKMNALFRFVETCQQNNIQLFVFVSPRYSKMKGKSAYLEISAELIENYDLIIHNYENDTTFINHPEYFADPLHLNKNGAELYTAFICSFIKWDITN